MNKEQFHDLTDMTEINKFITGSDLKDVTNRTLLYGYTCARDTWHVYLKNGHITTVVYKHDEKPTLVEVVENRYYIPSKRLYPECCDYEFCKLLKEKEEYLPFTTWQDRPEQKQYWGETL
jgi:hypothetical protein